MYIDIIYMINHLCSRQSLS